MSAPPSVGASKFGAETNLSSLPFTMVKLAESPPLTIENVVGSPVVSGSFAISVSTAVVFSATLGAPDEVIVGAVSFRSVTVTAIDWTADRFVPSLACTCTS